MATTTLPPPATVAEEGRTARPAVDRAAGARAVFGATALVGLLAVQAALGYEWFVSGLTKVVRGGFPAGLADELSDKSVGAPGWYRWIVDEVLIPNGTAVGYATEILEIAIGLVLVGVAVAFVFMPERLSTRTSLTLLTLNAGALAAAVLLNVNFHLASSSTHPWLIPADGFEEGVDLDSLMPTVELILLVVSIVAIRRLRRSRRGVDLPAGVSNLPAGVATPPR